MRKMVDSCNAGDFLFIALLAVAIVGASATPQVPAMFVFGDSLVDDGNNNYLRSIARANFYPHGIDFYQGPTGRFCNGKTVIDAMCDLLNQSYLPAYTRPGLNGTGLLGGVNYASAAGGILDETGKFLGERYSLKQQVLNFGNNLNELRGVLGGGRNFSQYLAKSIVVMVLGSNDYINNYLRPPLYSSSYNYSPEQYADLLLNQYTSQILALHSLGLKKFVLAAVGPLGCIPDQRASGMALPGRCVDRVNHIVDFFNKGLRSLVKQLNSDHSNSDAMFVFGNVYDAIQDMLDNPATYGFQVVDTACCGLGRYRGQVSCLPLSLPCLRRNEYVFWDAFHPTQAVNLILAKKAYAGPQTDMYPINLRQLAQL